MWGRISRVIAQESVPPRVAGMFYQAVVAAVLLYGSKTWCLSDTAMHPLEGFHVEAVRRLTGWQPRKVKGVWIYSHSAGVLRAAGVKTLEHYIDKQRYTIATTIQGRSILEEWKRAERLTGTPLPLLLVAEETGLHRGGEGGERGDRGIRKH